MEPATIIILVISLTTIFWIMIVLADKHDTKIRELEEEISELKADIRELQNDLYDHKLLGGYITKKEKTDDKK